MTSPIDDVRARIGSSLRNLVAGDREPRREPPADGGLFGADSATWQVHGDASMLVGGIRALVVQTLHPPTMAGVADHSDYRHDPLGRLQRTSDFLGTTTFGTVAQAERAIAVVNTIHERVVGNTPDGTPYSARDPHLLAWVHATEVDSFLVAKRRFGSTPIDDATADSYVEEMGLVAERLGVIDPPRTVAQLQTTLRSYEPELRVTRQSREALRFITFAPLPLPMRIPYGILFGGAMSSLPPWLRRHLRVPNLRVAEAVTVRPAAQTLVRVLEWSLKTPE